MYLISFVGSAKVKWNFRRDVKTNAGGTIFCSKKNWLVVWTHLKNISQIGNLPQIEVKVFFFWNHHLVIEKTRPSTFQDFQVCFFGLRLRSKISMGILTGNFHEVPTEQKHEKKKTINYTPETNIAPENRPSQKATSIPTIHFQVRAVSFREGRALRSPSNLSQTQEFR